MTGDGLLSTEEYAARRGISPRAVRKAITSERLFRCLHRQGKNWKIDPDMADEEWEKNTTNKVNTPIVPLDSPSRKRKDEQPATLDRRPTQAEAQATRTAIQAKLLGLEYMRRQGELVRRDAVKKGWFEANRRARDKFRRLPMQVIGEVARVAGGLTLEQRTELLILWEQQIAEILNSVAGDDPTNVES